MGHLPMVMHRRPTMLLVVDVVGAMVVALSGALVGAMAAATPTVGITMIVHTAKSVAALYDEGYQKDDKHSGCSGGCTVLLS
jgi:hypothetical protein